MAMRHLHLAALSFALDRRSGRREAAVQAPAHRRRGRRDLARP